MNTNQTLFNSPLAPKTYVVGGAVRDMLLKQPVNDIDYVVTVSEEEFLTHFPNAEMVGVDFPVFLIDGDEVALSRTEQSNGDGYGAFELTGVGVSIEDDLKRRDFTINAMAMNIVTNEIVDPFNGAQDMQNKVIKVTHDESFLDDPVRILRAFRFATRFEFALCDDTVAQAKEFAFNLQHVTKERIVLELEKVWKQSTKPSHFFRQALKAGALSELLPALAKLDTVPAGPVEHHGTNTAFDHTMETVDRAKQMDAPFHVFVAMVFHDIGKAFTDPGLLPHHFKHEKKSEAFALDFFADHKFSKRVNEFVPKAVALHMKRLSMLDMTPKRLVKFAMEIGRRDFADMLTVFAADHPLSAKEHEVLAVLRNVLFNLDLSVVATVPAKERANKAHQLRVEFVKRIL